jgi:hypothetical protein
VGEKSSEAASWRRRLRRELTGLLALKVAALALLWWLFFSPPHRITVDGETASRRFGVTPSPLEHQGERRAPEPRSRPGRAASGASQ